MSLAPTHVRCPSVSDTFEFPFYQCLWLLRACLLIFSAGENLKMLQILVVVDNTFASKKEINIDCSIVQFV